MPTRTFTLGLVINPIAGMGGSVGLKGTDGPEILRKARELGAKPGSGNRAREFLECLAPVAAETTIITAPGAMGKDVLEQVNRRLEIPFNYDVVLGDVISTKGDTAPSDTVKFVGAVAGKVDLLVFAGGDGTARDVLSGLEGAGARQAVVLGIPAGVKIHSNVFAVNPRDAAILAMKFLAGEVGVTEGEVMDIDELAFREDRVEARLYGYMNVPHEPAYLQGTKQGSPATISDKENKERIARYIIRHMNDSEAYLVGPGSTTKPILDLLGLEKTLLGVDAVVDGKLVGKDLNEQQMLEFIKEQQALGRTVKIIVTVIGAQGFLFGRGNLQFSPAVIRAVGIKNIIIIMTRYKVTTLPSGKMRNDTRDPALDEEMRGYYRVLVDNGEYRVIKLE